MKTLTYHEQAVLKVISDAPAIGLAAGGQLISNRTGFPVSGVHRTAASLVRKGLVARERRHGIVYYRRRETKE